MYSFGHADTKCQIYTAIFNILVQKYPQSPLSACILLTTW